jgi:hypothetical protein
MAPWYRSHCFPTTHPAWDLIEVVEEGSGLVQKILVRKEVPRVVRDAMVDRAISARRAELRAEAAALDESY